MTINKSQMLSIVRYWYLNEITDIIQNEDGLDLDEVIEQEGDSTGEDVYLNIKIKD